MQKMGPRYVIKDAHSQKVQEMTYQVHRNRLDQITKKGPPKKVHDEDFGAKMAQLRTSNMRFVNNERYYVIDKNNQILLERLVGISKKQGPLHRDMSVDALKPTKTLNFGSRKKEQMRIQNENESFARRILAQRPLFDRKSLEKDFKDHLKFTRQIQKFDYTPKAAKLLPFGAKKKKRRNKSADMIEAEDVSKEEKQPQIEGGDKPQNSNEDPKQENKQESEKNVNIKATDDPSELAQSVSKKQPEMILLIPK